MATKGTPITLSITVPSMVGKGSSQYTSLRYGNLPKARWTSALASVLFWGRTAASATYDFPGTCSGATTVDASHSPTVSAAAAAKRPTVRNRRCSNQYSPTARISVTPTLLVSAAAIAAIPARASNQGFGLLRQSTHMTTASKKINGASDAILPAASMSAGLNARAPRQARATV